MVYSTAVDLQKLKSYHQWVSGILEDKTSLTPIIVDKIVNEGDLYSLSLYQNLYADTAYIPDVSEIHSENDLAIVMGCHWIEQSGFE